MKKTVAKEMDTLMKGNTENATYNFSITNVLGQVIRSGKLSLPAQGGDGMIDMGIISSGTYYLQIDNRFWKIVKK